MSTTALIPCDALDPENRVKRLAAVAFVTYGAMRMKDEFKSRPVRPGFCTFCGAQLATTWRAVKWEVETETFRWVESDHSPEKLADVEKFKALPTDTGLRKGYLLAPVTICEVMTREDVWDKARALLIEEQRRLRQQMEVKERAESEREKRAIKALARGEEY